MKKEAMGIYTFEPQTLSKEELERRTAMLRKMREDLVKEMERKGVKRW